LCLGLGWCGAGARKNLLSRHKPRTQTTVGQIDRKSTGGSPGEQLELNSIACYDRFWKVELSLSPNDSIVEGDFRETAQTGNLVLFRGKKGSAVLQCHLNRDEFDLFALVILNIRDEILLFEVIGGCGSVCFAGSGWCIAIFTIISSCNHLVIQHRPSVARARTHQGIPRADLKFLNTNIGCEYEYPSRSSSENTRFRARLVSLAQKNLLLQRTHSPAV